MPFSKSISQNVVSLARVLSKYGLTSRTQAEQLITAGRVSVNGKVIRNPSFRCRMGSEEIAVDSKRIKRKELIYIAMNKPVGIITTRSDERDRKTVYDILGDVGRWVFPVGRLDKDTSGLLLFTNDTRFGEQLTNPLSKVQKKYHATLDQQMKKETIILFQKGMALDGEKLLPVKVTMLNDKEVELSLLEGKNRQIRHMFETLGYKIRSLIRIKIGNFELRNLKPGEWKYMTKAEIHLVVSK